MQGFSFTRNSRQRWTGPLIFLFLLAPTILMIFLYAPTESTMGDVQRILYVHVPVAWCGLVACLAMGVSGAMYLRRRNPVWDHWCQAAAEVGWLCSTLTLVTGSLWAHEAWGVWWTWEPRLTFSLVLWLIYMGYFVVRGSFEDPQRRARAGALMALLGVADVPIILMATRLFRGVHPITPEMDGRMRLTLMVSAVSFLAFFGFLTCLRRQQLNIAEQCAVLETQDTSYA